MTWPHLVRAGFGADQMEQIVDNLDQLGKPTDRIVAGLDHAEWELENGKMLDKAGQPVADPCSWVFTALARTGYYRRPKGYISPEEQAAKDAEAEAKAVVAARLSVCDSGDGAPFFDLCMFGQNNDLRGYDPGRYRDHTLAAVQVEYRRDLFWRIGAVAFAGVGGVAPSFDKFGSNLLPAAGVGLRLKASKAHRVNASIDFAFGEDSHAFYFYIGEAF